MRWLRNAVICLGILIHLLNLCIVAVAEETRASDKPNIVLIYGDDVGAMDIGFSGGRACPTPNLDKLAGQGIIFTDAYSMTATCAPSRMALITGQYPTSFDRYQVYGRRTSGNSKHMRLIPPPKQRVDFSQFSTFADVLKTVGYRTAVMGKWHITGRGCTPKEMGFDVEVGTADGAGNPGQRAGYHSPYDYPPRIKQDKPGEYLTDRLTDEAIKFITANRDQPFMLYLPYYTIHTPMEPREDLLAKAKALINERGDDYRYTPEMMGMIMALDENAGRLVNAIDELGLGEDTVIIFSGDNGSWGKSPKKLEPLRNKKASFFEGGIRVPMCVRWTGHIKAGQIEKTPVAQIDYFPTFLALSGAEVPAENKLDGVNLLPLMVENRALSERSIYWHFPLYKGSGRANAPEENVGENPMYAVTPGSSIRRGKWKLTEYSGTGTIELYDLYADIGETRNLAKENPEVVSGLLADLNAWQKAAKAPIATEKNPRFDAAALQSAINALQQKE